MTTLSPLTDPTIAVTLPNGEVREYLAVDIAGELAVMPSGLSQAERIRRAFKNPGLSAGQCMRLHLELQDYLTRIEASRSRQERNARLMRFYHIQPSELENLDEVDKIGLLQQAGAIEAQERLAFINSLSIFLAGKEASQEALTQLSKVAYQDHPEELAKAIEASTRKG